jgi:hypothetical protein
MNNKLSFAYLYYTVGESTGHTPLLLGVFKSSKIAKTHLDLVNGEYVPISRSNRVLQKINNTTGQYWYVEKHIMKDGVS